MVWATKGGALKRIRVLFLRLLYLYRPTAYARSIGVRFGHGLRLVGRVGFGSEPYLITLGNHVSITSSRFITHDGGIWVDRANRPRADVIGPIKVGDNVFIGVGCIILPNVRIGDNVVVGAGSVVTRDIPSNSVAVGVPARVVKSVEEYVQKAVPRMIETKGLSPAAKRKRLQERFSGSGSCQDDAT